MSAPWALGFFFVLLRWLGLYLFSTIIKLFHAIGAKLVPLVTKPKVIPAVI